MLGEFSRFGICSLVDNGGRPLHTLLECVLRDHHHGGYGSRHERKLYSGVSNGLNFEMPLCHELIPQSAQELPRHAKARPFGTMRAIPVSGAIYLAGLILSPPLSAATIFGRTRLIRPDHDHGNQKPYGENDRRNRIDTMKSPPEHDVLLSQ
jgi:hypothetical protein